MEKNTNLNESRKLELKNRGITDKTKIYNTTKNSFFNFQGLVSLYPSFENHI